MQTDGQGIYEFTGLRPGTYSITQYATGRLRDGRDVLARWTAPLRHGRAVTTGSMASSVPGPAPTASTTTSAAAAGGGAVHTGQTATIGSAEPQRPGADSGRSRRPDATPVGDWLAATFPNLYGAGPAQ